MTQRDGHVSDKEYHIPVLYKGSEAGLINCFASGCPDLVDTGSVSADNMSLPADDLKAATGLKSDWASAWSTGYSKSEIMSSMACALQYIHLF